MEALGKLLVLPVEELDSAVEVSLGLGDEPSAAAGDLVSSLFSSLVSIIIVLLYSLDIVRGVV